VRDADKSTLMILIVDDNVMNQNLVAIVLTTLGHSSVVAANGEQAMEALDGRTFDMVFMDCQMPVLDGFGATREIRRRESGSEAHIPIVALTANAMEGDRERCLAAGMEWIHHQARAASRIGTRDR
jgi:CheY-like chemotaxis protein